MKDKYLVGGKYKCATLAGAVRMELRLRGKDGIFRAIELIKPVSGRCSFSALQIGARFEFNGAEWYKASERTARLVENNRVFYFKSGEVVTATGLVHP